jgi:SAM-dependent methyltransferase
VGCGPELPYRKNGAFVIGVDASFHSIRANEMVDVRVFASAASLPLRSASADAIVCFYSIHHMTGQSVTEHRDIVRNVFREFARVLKPSRRLMVFDVSPRWPFGAIEELTWNTVRRRLGQNLDMFFWKKHDLEMLGRETFPRARFSIERFGGSPFKTFPPIFSKPSLRVPRLLYPFDINLYTWQLDDGQAVD